MRRSAVRKETSCSSGKGEALIITNIWMIIIIISMIIIIIWMIIIISMTMIWMIIIWMIFISMMIIWMTSRKMVSDYSRWWSEDRLFKTMTMIINWKLLKLQLLFSGMSFKITLFGVDNFDFMNYKADEYFWRSNWLTICSFLKIWTQPGGVNRFLHW